jgi:hypothetical protein
MMMTLAILMDAIFTINKVKFSIVVSKLIHTLSLQKFIINNKGNIYIKIYILVS